MRNFQFIVIFFLLYSITGAQTHKINCNTYVGDVDGDGTDDFIKIIDKKTVKVFKSDFELTPLSSRGVTVNQDIELIFVGDFLNTNNPHNNVIVVATNDYIHLLEYNSKDKTRFRSFQSCRYLQREESG